MSNAKKGVLGSFLLIAGGVGEKSIGIVSTLILARVLVPEDFGVVAITTLIMGFIDFADTGANQYLQRCETVTDKIVNSAWTLEHFDQGTNIRAITLILVSNCFVF